MADGGPVAERLPPGLEPINKAVQLAAEDAKSRWGCMLDEVAQVIRLRASSG